MYESPWSFPHLVIYNLTVCCLSNCIVTITVTRVNSFFHCFAVIWSSSLLFSSLLTFDLSDLETSVESRCTTDSADSAFIGRRYWSLASSSSPFLSSSPLPSSSTQEVRLQIWLLDENRNIFFNVDFYVESIFLFVFMFTCLFTLLQSSLPVVIAYIQ